MSEVAKQDSLVPQNTLAPPFEEGVISDELMRDAFTALSLSVLRDFMISSDTKYFIFEGMMSNLRKMNHPPEEIEAFRNGMNVAIAKFSRTSSFMG